MQIGERGVHARTLYTLCVVVTARAVLCCCDSERVKENVDVPRVAAVEFSQRVLNVLSLAQYSAGCCVQLLE